MAIKYTALVGAVDKITKPQLDVEREKTPSVNELQTTSLASLRRFEIKPSFSLKDLVQTISQLVAKEFKALAENFQKEIKEKLDIGWSGQKTVILIIGVIRTREEVDLQ